MCSRHGVIYQQLLERGMGQESEDLKWFVHPHLLVLLASGSVSSPSTDLEVPLHQRIVSSQFRQDWVLQLATHLNVIFLWNQLPGKVTISCWIQVFG